MTDEGHSVQGEFMPKLMTRVSALLIITALVGLLAAMWAGLIRVGWVIPPLRPTLPLAHGPLMVSGFLGTVIGVERAVALGKRWTYSGPVLTAIGTVLLMVGVPGLPGPLLMTLGSVMLVVVFIEIIRRHPALFTAVMGIAAVLWVVGNGLWLFGQPLSTVAFWWAGFLTLTIAGERLELSRLLRLSRGSYRAFVGAIGLFMLGLVLTLVAFDPGVRLSGIGLVALALWLLRHDIARHTVRQSGLRRFIAVCLLSGYAWLGVSGGMALFIGGVRGGPQYGALLHALFLGFVMAMIFGHAPIVFPSVLNRQMAYYSVSYIPLAVLHFSLLLRVIGDLLLWIPGRQWGAMLNVIALLLFLANTVYALRGGAAGTAPTTGA